MTSLQRTIGVGQGVALYLGAVLGPGILVLPALAAETAGPASLIAWAAMIALSLPIALTFSALARTYPHAGGFAQYVEQAFGPTAGALTGWIFFFTIMLGFPFPVLIAGQYGAAIFGLGRDGAYLVGGGLAAVVLIANFFGLRLSARMQVAVTTVTILIIAAAIGGAIPRLQTGTFTPFLPHGVLTVGTATVQIFTAFVGWEVITPLAEEFRNPERDIKRATLLALIVVGVIYAAVAIITIGTHTYGETLLGAPPMGAMAAQSFGIGAQQAIGVMALFVTFATVNAYVAGITRLGFALGRAGQLPTWFATIHPRWQTPYHSLMLVGGAFVLSTSASYLLNLQLSDAITVITSATIVVYLLSMAAAIKLLRGAGRVAAVITLAAFLIVLPFIGFFLAWIAAVAAACLIYQRRRARQIAVAEAVDLSV